MQIDLTRILKKAWHDDGIHKVVELISKRVEDMTKLSVAFSEILQVNFHGVGGVLKTF